MPNEISNQGGPSLNLTSVRGHGQAQNKLNENTSGQHSVKSDQVSLTANGRILEEAINSLKTQSPIDDKRVAEIRQQIQDGTFEIDATKIAQRLLETEADLFRS